MRTLHIIITIVFLSLLVAIGSFVFFFVDFDEPLDFDYEFVPVEDFHELTAMYSIPARFLCNDETYFLSCMAKMIEGGLEDSIVCMELNGTVEGVAMSDLCFVALSYSRDDIRLCRFIDDVNVKSSCYGTVSKICTLNPYIDLMGGVIDYTTHFSVCEEWFEGYTDSDLDEYGYLLERLETEGISDYDDDLMYAISGIAEETDTILSYSFEQKLMLALGDYGFLFELVGDVREI